MFDEIGHIGADVAWHYSADFNTGRCPPRRTRKRCFLPGLPAVAIAFVMVDDDSQRIDASEHWK